MSKRTQQKLDSWFKRPETTLRPDVEFREEPGAREEPMEIEEQPGKQIYIYMPFV